MYNEQTCEYHSCDTVETRALGFARFVHFLKAVAGWVMPLER